jgi:hypothetical protein
MGPIIEEEETLVIGEVSVRLNVRNWPTGGTS